MKNEYWEKEEFEDLVNRSLIALYETKVNKTCKVVPSFLRVSHSELDVIRKSGHYFSPYDREYFFTEIDIKNDGIPIYATRADKIFKKCSHLPDEYLRSYHFFRVKNPPDAFWNEGGMFYYKQIVVQMTSNNKIWLQKSYVAINREGIIHDAVIKNSSGKYLIAPIGVFGEDENGPIKSDIVSTALTIGLWQDRIYLWNVTAIEGHAKATFGVYPEQIKSLFYSRELPLTETGRKRPILHWVASHQRRLKKGIDIDIDKYLRGTNEFIYQGTKFKITRPLKQTG